MSFTYHLPPVWSTTAAPCCRARVLPPVVSRPGAARPGGSRAQARALRSLRGCHGRPRRGAAAYTDDSAPRSRLATLSLCTITPPPVRAWQPGTDGLLPIPCSIVRHKPTTRAALEPNKPHRSDHIVGPPVCTEVTFSHIRHSLGSAAAMGHSATVTRYIVIRNDPHRGSSHRCKIFIVAGNRPRAVRTARFCINTLRNQYTSINVFPAEPSGRLNTQPMVANVTSDAGGGTDSPIARQTSGRDRVHQLAGPAGVEPRGMPRHQSAVRQPTRPRRLIPWPPPTPTGPRRPPSRR